MDRLILAHSPPSPAEQVELDINNTNNISTINSNSTSNFNSSATTNSCCNFNTTAPVLSSSPTPNLIPSPFPVPPSPTTPSPPPSQPPSHLSPPPSHLSPLTEVSFPSSPSPPYDLFPTEIILNSEIVEGTNGLDIGEIEDMLDFH